MRRNAALEYGQLRRCRTTTQRQMGNFSRYQQRDLLSLPHDAREALWKISGSSYVTFGTKSSAGRFERCLKLPLDRHENSGIARAREGAKPCNAGPRLQPSLMHDIEQSSGRRCD
jgi:hypothetical protein